MVIYECSVVRPDGVAGSSQGLVPGNSDAIAEKLVDVQGRRIVAAVKTGKTDDVAAVDAKAVEETMAVAAAVEEAD